MPNSPRTPTGEGYSLDRPTQVRGLPVGLVIEVVSFIGFMIIGMPYAVLPSLIRGIGIVVPGHRLRATGGGHHQNRAHRANGSAPFAPTVTGLRALFLAGPDRIEFDTAPVQARWRDGRSALHRCRGRRQERRR